jgi:hypothetical protein
MTHVEMQQAVLDEISESLQDTITLRNRISISFGQWFRALLQPSAAPDAGAAPPPDAGTAPPPAEGAPA